MISVIMSNYNYGRYIAQAIKSVLAQTDQDFELVIVDDGSTDNSWDIIKEYKSKYSEKILAIRQKNQGQAVAFNSGFYRSKGEYICFIDSDDLWMCDKLDFVQQVFSSHHDIALLQHNLMIICNDGKTKKTFRDIMISGDVFKETQKTLQVPQFSPTTGLCFPRWVLKRVLPIPVDFKTCADGYLTRTAFCFGNVMATHKSYGYYRLHENNRVFGNKKYEMRSYVYGLLLPELNNYYKSQNIELQFPIAVTEMGLRKRINPMYVYGKRADIYNALTEYLRRCFLKIGICLSHGDQMLYHMKGRYRNERCFIMGRGIYSNKLDLAKFRDEFVIACDCLLMYEGLGELTRGMYCVSDNRVWGNGLGVTSNFVNGLKKIKALHKMFNVGAKRPLKEISNLSRDRITYRVVNTKRYVWKGELENDVLREFCWGDHVVLDMCIPLAMYLGFSEIVFLGCDWDIQKEKMTMELFLRRYAYEKGPMARGKYFPDKNPSGIPREEIWRDGFSTIREVCRKNDIKLINGNGQLH
jgi:glycosyltransferase involved in cell wall biosynthesis